jgi:antitoxin component YwqK of YwqJK toxin-antitoxin module
LDGDGRAERISTFQDGVIVRAEEDKNGDGIPELVAVYEAGVLKTQKEDSDGNGSLDRWATYEEGKLIRVAQDSNGDGCEEQAQELSPEGIIEVEQFDTSGDCKVDTWKIYTEGKLAIAATDPEATGKPTTLTRYNAEGKAIVQELRSGDRTHPEKKLFLNGEGGVSFQCEDANDNGIFESQAIVKDGIITQILLATQNEKKADQREWYEDGALVKLEADATGNGTPDVIQYYRGDKLQRQDEDSDGDGVLDWSFVGGKPAELPAEATEPMKPLANINCGRSHGFWASH